MVIFLQNLYQREEGIIYCPPKIANVFSNVFRQVLKFKGGFYDVHIRLVPFWSAAEQRQ